MKLLLSDGKPNKEKVLELAEKGQEIATPHNHPSGNLTPSEADKILTERLMTCGKYMDIKMLDHIIVAGETGEMFSFKGEGLMNQIERNALDWSR